jgi:hypothetical protein
MARYRITFGNGDSPIDVEGELSIRSTLRAKYGYDVEYGHDGDLRGGGDRTLFWRSAEESIDDDGARALGSVHRLER